MPMRNTLLILIYIASGLLMQAQNKPLDAATINKIKAGVADCAAGTNTISSDFTQEKEMSILNDKIITGGKFYFKKENQLRWEYIHPFSYVITIKGDKITILNEGKISSFNSQSNKIFDEVNKIIIGSVRGTLLDDDTFSASYTQSNGHYIVRLTPLSPKLKESLQEIVIHFNKKDFSVDRLEMIEQAGDCTKINFTDKRINEPISDEKFILR